MERSKTLFANNMIVHVENLMEPSKLLLELICEFSNVAEYKIYVPKSMYFYIKQ